MQWIVFLSIMLILACILLWSSICGCCGHKLGWVKKNKTESRQVRFAAEPTATVNIEPAEREDTHLMPMTFPVKRPRTPVMGVKGRIKRSPPKSAFKDMSGKDILHTSVPSGKLPRSLTITKATGAIPKRKTPMPLPRDLAPKEKAPPPPPPATSLDSHRPEEVALPMKSKIPKLTKRVRTRRTKKERDRERALSITPRTERRLMQDKEAEGDYSSSSDDLLVKDCEKLYTAPKNEPESTGHKELHYAVSDIVGIGSMVYRK